MIATRKAPAFIPNARRLWDWPTRALLVALAGAACIAWRAQDPRSEVQRLVDAGQYADAERMARAGGVPLSIALGDILVLRGRLAAAESTYTKAIASRAPDQVLAEAALAELAIRHGDRPAAMRRARAITDAYATRTRATRDEHIAAGRAFVLLMSGDASSARSALAAFDAATALDSANLEATRRVGDLFLEKYNAPDARVSYESVLRRAPTDARAQLGMARVEDFEGKGSAMTTVRKSLASNPSLSDALALLTRLHLEAENYDSARTNAQRALAVDSASMQAWALLGATAWLTGDSATLQRARKAAFALQTRPSDFFAELAEASVRHRRYADATAFAKQAVTFDSTSVRALGVLGTNQLRQGDMADGQATLDRAFKLDPFNVWHKNTLDLLDKMRAFRTIDAGRFRIVAPLEEAELLSLYVLPLLERAFDSLAVRYAYKPPLPIRLEFYRQHADFSVRTVGMAGLGALGVSFGSLLAMDAPDARERSTFNWGSTAWHELTHAFTLGASEHRTPRWLSEGMSVFEERRAAPGWGANATVSFVSAFDAGMLRPISQLNDGFLRPRFPEETQFSYYQASLFCEMVVELRGMKALPAMLVGYRDGLDTPGVFQRVLGMTTAQVDAQFDAYLRKLFAVPLRAMTGHGKADSTGGEFRTTMERALALIKSGQKDSARVALERARAMFPEYSGSDGPSWFLAGLARDRADTASALRHLSEVTTRNETAWDANLLEAKLREQTGDVSGALAALERTIWIFPYEPTIHAQLAALASARKDFPRAVRERRAVVALKPADMLDARYELARALASSGDVAAARRELLDVLEQAPSFEKAQGLLLELRSKGNP